MTEGVGQSFWPREGWGPEAGWIFVDEGASSAKSSLNRSHHHAETGGSKPAHDERGVWHERVLVCLWV